MWAVSRQSATQGDGRIKSDHTDDHTTNAVDNHAPRVALCVPAFELGQQEGNVFWIDFPL